MNAKAINYLLTLTKTQLLDENEALSIDNVKDLALAALFDVLPISFYWMNKEGVLLGCNKKVLRDLNYKFEDYIGKHSTKIVTEEAWLNSKKVMDTGKTQIIEEVHKKPDSSYITYLSIKSPIFDSTKKVVGLLGISIDVTDQKNAEKLRLETNRLQIEKAAAEKLAKAMEMVSGFIAHEMKTPLAIVNLNNDLLSLDLKNEELDLNSPDAKERINNYHDNIQFAVYSADNIIGMLLTKLSNLKSVRLGPADYEFTPIKQTIDAAVKQYPFLKYEKPLLHWNPKANEDFKYFGRDDLTKNILFNLIRNALRAIKEYDKGEIFITLASDEKFNYLIFKDTGMGIPESHMTNLFQQFNTHTNGGSGLGLAFCKMVMNSYGGDITCKSKDREFTEFTLSFPKDGSANTTLKQKITARQAKQSV